MYKNPRIVKIAITKTKAQCNAFLTLIMINPLER
jgi:hypothetical protein